MNQPIIYIISSLDVTTSYYHIVCNSYHKILFSQKSENSFLNIGAEII